VIQSRYLHELLSPVSQWLPDVLSKHELVAHPTERNWWYLQVCSGGQIMCPQLKMTHPGKMFRSKCVEVVAVWDVVPYCKNIYVLSA
jgi:hypothetical protein